MMKRTSMNLQRPSSCRAADARDILCRGSESGSILIVTIWVVLVLTGLTLVFARSMRVEAIATANHISSLESEGIARGAVNFIKARLNSDDDTDIKLEGETPYRAISVGKGYFWLLRPDLDDDDAYYYGIRDESGKINMNEADYEMLMDLPNMTSELAYSIIDWRDSDSITDGGAESEYYLLLDSPYYCKDSELESVEEVLLIKGASLEIMFGEDTNRNGVLDSNENDGDESEPDDNRNGRLDRGFYDYVTVYSTEPNENSSGEQRVDITSRDSRQKLMTLLQQAGLSVDQFQAGQFLQGYSFSSVLDFYLKAQDYLGLTEDQFKKIENEISASSSDTITGLINVNTAPKEVLLCIPGLEESDAEALVRKRNADGTDTGSMAWVAEALPEKASAIGRYITIHSYQYSADIIGVSGDGRAFSRYRMVADTSDEEFKIIYWKSLKHLGWPIDPEIMTKLRAGEAIED
jgi:type II secretory pathway component PulK